MSKGGWRGSIGFLAEKGRRRRDGKQTWGSDDPKVKGIY